MRLQALKARPRRRRLPPDPGERQVAAVAANVLDRSFEAPAPNRKWIADFTYVCTAEAWLYVAAVVDLLLIGRRGKPAMIVSDNGTEFTSNAILAWAKDHGVEWNCISPGKPMQIVTLGPR